jgi:predicted transcriptional regulator
MPTSLKTDDALKNRDRRLADEQARSAHWIQPEVVRPKAREDFRHEALKSWANFQETGRHLTGKEVRDWLNTWGIKNEKAAPESHK